MGGRDGASSVSECGSDSVSSSSSSIVVVVVVGVQVTAPIVDA